MNELINVLHALIAEADARRAAAFCVILEKRGAAPREPGAAMLVRTDGTALGTIGGGAVEIAVQKHAAQLLHDFQSIPRHAAQLPQNPQPSLLEYSLDEDYNADDSSICGGHLSVGIVPIVTSHDAQPFRAALAAAQRGETAQIPIILERGEYHLHVEVPPTLLIAGAGHVGLALARFAAELDFRVIVFDDRADLLTAARFAPEIRRFAGDIAARLADYPLDASCYVVIVTRGHRHDRAALEAVINRPTAYVGMIGSRKKVAAIRAALQAAGYAPDRIARVHAPIGLAIGAETVNEIAISILAELIQTRRQTTPKLITGPHEG